MTDSPQDDEAPPRPSRLARWVLGSGVTVVLGFGLWLALRPEAPVPTTTTAQPLPTSTTPPTTRAITTTLAPTTTVPATATTSPPLVPTYDVVVVGDGLGGASAATAAARLGANVALLSPIGYLGGQAGAAGVSTMDEGSNHFVQRRSGIYGELASFAQAIYGPDVGDCYFIEDSMCPEPVVVEDFFAGLVSNAGVDVYPMATLEDAIQEESKVAGVRADGSTYNAEIVIDATEFSDLYPMVEGLNYEIGNETGCVQDTTWLAIRAWNPPGAGSLVPPETAASDLRAVYGAEVDAWLDGFRSRVVLDPNREPSGPAVVPWDIATETRYRALADRRDFSLVNEVPEITRTGVNYANDHPLTAAAIEDPAVRVLEFRKALHKTYAFLWYLRWELGVTDWGIDTGQQFSQAQRLLWDDLIPDDLERSLPPYPYVREGRRLITVQTLTNNDLSNDVRGLHRFDDSVMLGGYFSDFHGCLEEGAGQGFGLFEVPMGVFIPETIDGFMPGMARSAGVSRLAASAVRTQPEEIWSGEAIGIIAALAARDDIEVRNVDAAEVQQHLLANDLIFFLPG